MTIQDIVKLVYKYSCKFLCERRGQEAVDYSSAPHKRKMSIASRSKLL